MNQIEHFIEPTRLLLVWQRPLDGGPRRHRRVVGEILQESVGDVVFRYLFGTSDFEAAEEEGFSGFPAFKLDKTRDGDRGYRSNVLYAFTSRMTSRKRGDFAEYLVAHWLPENFTGSDFSLLAHTGARLPGDGFEIMADLSTVKEPFDMVMEVAGTRFQTDTDLQNVAIGDAVALVAEPDNPFDPNAIRISHKSGSLGYVPKPHCAALKQKIASGLVSGRIQKLNGRPERRLVYLLMQVGNAPLRS